MTCSVAIHQPEHMPWGGFFNKMNKSNVFVILDTVQFSKNNWQNRNRFVCNKGNMFWLTVPIKLKGHLKKEFREIEIVDNHWKKKYLNSLKMNYSKAPYFSLYWPEIERIFSCNYCKLIDLNMHLIDYFRDILSITNKLIYSSSLQVKGNKSSFLLDICKKLNATSYISGEGGKTYLDISLFKNEGIELIFNTFQPNISNSLHLYKGASILDMLFWNSIESTKAYVFG